MDFSLSTEQQMLRDSVDKFLERDYDFAARRALASSPLGYSEKNWKLFADLGWLAIPFAESSGGYGGSPVDTMVLLEAFGKALVTEPYIPTILLGGRLLELLGNEAQRRHTLGAVIAGEMQLALAHTERKAGGNPACVNCRAVRAGQVAGGRSTDHLISGEKIMVLNGGNADRILLSARISGGDRDPRGVVVFLLAADTPGISRRDYPTIDGLRAADFHFNEVRVAATSLLGADDAAALEQAADGAHYSAIEKVIDEAIIALGAEAVGAMEVLYKTSIAYALERKQFGSPIGKFQVIQHRLVDMFMACEQSRSLLYMAALHALEGGELAQRSASALKVQIGKAGRFIGEQAVQIHGGMGTTDELRIGHYLKRLLAIDTLLGSRDYHLDRYADLGPAAGG